MKKIWAMRTAIFMALSVTTPVFAGNWIQDPSRPANENGVSNWWYQNDDGSYPAGNWTWIDGNQDGIAESYRFDENGWLYVSTNIDGYEVNDSGAWITNGLIETKNMESLNDTNDTTQENEENDSSVSELTDEEAYKKIIALKKDYPEGMKWNNSNSYVSGYRIGYGCAGFAFMVQDAVFGKEAKKTRYDTLEWDMLRVGDHLRIYNSIGGEHSIIVLTIEDDYITICEGNYSSSIHWKRKITLDDLEENFIYRETCYEE